MYMCIIYIIYVCTAYVCVCVLYIVYVCTYVYMYIRTVSIHSTYIFVCMYFLSSCHSMHVMSCIHVHSVLLPDYLGGDHNCSR